VANKGTWKISIGGSSFADYTDILQPEGIGGGPNIMEIQGYGAAAPVYLNLGNYKLPRRFTMTRTHASDTAAHAWYQTATATWAGVANVVLTHIDYSGTETTFTINGAKVEIEVETPIGPTTITRITITGGAAS
jgi:hypothetical protein